MQTKYIIARDVTDGGSGANPGSLNVKTGPPPQAMFRFKHSLVFSRLLFFCVFQIIFR